MWYSHRSNAKIAISSEVDYIINKNGSLKMDHRSLPGEERVIIIMYDKEVYHMGFIDKVKEFVAPIDESDDDNSVYETQPVHKKKLK